MSSTCKLKKTSAIRSAVTPSSFCCRDWGLAFAHSRVLRLRSFAKEGRGGVFGVPLLLSGAFWVFSISLRLCLVPSASEYDPSSGTRLRSDELLEWPKAFCSRKATSLAGEMRFLGTASSSMVFPRARDDGGALSVKLRREIEVKLRSRRFYWEVQRGLSARRHARGVLHVGAAMVCRGDWVRRELVARVGRRAWRPFIPTAQWRWVECKRGESGDRNSYSVSGQAVSRQ
jgi:hypothetical protein